MLLCYRCFGLLIPDRNSIHPDSGHSDGEPGPVIGRFTCPSSEVCFSASTVGDLF